MTRGLMDPAPVPEDNDTPEGIDEAIDDLYMGQNMLHDRLVNLEKKLDHGCKNCKCKSTAATTSENEAADRKFWKRGL